MEKIDYGNLHNLGLVGKDCVRLFLQKIADRFGDVGDTLLECRAALTTIQPPVQIPAELSSVLDLNISNGGKNRKLHWLQPDGGTLAVATCDNPGDFRVYLGPDLNTDFCKTVYRFFILSQDRYAKGSTN